MNKESNTLVYSSSGKNNYSGKSQSEKLNKTKIRIQKEIKLLKLDLCPNSVSITKMGTYITNIIKYDKWEKNNNFRKWL